LYNFCLQAAEDAARLQMEANDHALAEAMSYDLHAPEKQQQQQQRQLQLEAQRLLQETEARRVRLEREARLRQVVSGCNSFKRLID
jgi:hypothetical protein